MASELPSSNNPPTYPHPFTLSPPKPAHSLDGNSESDLETTVGSIQPAIMSEKEKEFDEERSGGGVEVDSHDEKHTQGLDPDSPFHPSQFPDGGLQAWSALLGTFCCLFCSFGWLNCVGVFQNYYQLHQLSQYSSSTIAWIPSLGIFFMFLPGPLVGFLYDNHGPRYLLIFGTFFHVFGLMMTSLCTEYWQFILAQGICSPLGLNCIFTAATSSVTTWFLKKRGAAFGIMAAGSGLGGIIFPIMTTHLIPQVGFGWTMRICAFMILGLLLVALVTVKSRLPPSPRKFHVRVFLEPFKDIVWVLLAGSSFLFFMGLFIPINFIEVEALKSGMSARLASYLIPILNAGSIFGRIIPGILADKLGRFNMQAVMSLLTALLVLCIWLPASGNGALVAFAALYGFGSGAYVSLAPAQIAFISRVEQIGVRVGMLFAGVSFAGLTGSPIAGAIVSHNHGSFDGLKVFSGAMMVAGAVGFAATRVAVGGLKMGKV